MFSHKAVSSISVAITVFILVASMTTSGLQDGTYQVQSHDRIDSSIV